MSHKYYDLTQLGGFPLNQERLAFMQASYTESVNAISSLIGDNVIVSGCIVNGNNVTDGWVIVGGELLPFVGGANVLQSTFLVRTSPTALLFKDGAQKEVQFAKYASFGVGAGAIEWASLARLGTFKGVYEDVKSLNVTTKVLSEQIITGQIHIDFPSDGSKTIIVRADPPEGVDPGDYVGFLDFGIIDRVTSSKYSGLNGKIEFVVIRESTDYGVTAMYDYVLIKKS